MKINRENMSLYIKYNGEWAVYSYYEDDAEKMFSIEERSSDKRILYKHTISTIPWDNEEKFVSIQSLESI